MQSILADDMRTCFLTGRVDWIEKHHVFGGANRKKSEKYGLFIPVTHAWHNEPPYGIHHNAELDLQIKQYAQRRFEEEGHTREEFMLEFGKNWLYTEDDGYEIDMRRYGISL